MKRELWGMQEKLNFIQSDRIVVNNFSRSLIGNNKIQEISLAEKLTVVFICLSSY